MCIQPFSLTCILSLRTTLCQLILGHIIALLFMHLTSKRSVGVTSLPVAQGCLKNWVSLPWKYSFDFGHECCSQLSPFINRCPLSVTKGDFNEMWRETWGEPECVFKKFNPSPLWKHQINPMHNWDWTYKEYVFFSHLHSTARASTDGKRDIYFPVLPQKPASWQRT